MAVEVLRNGFILEEDKTLRCLAMEKKGIQDNSWPNGTQATEWMAVPLGVVLGLANLRYLLDLRVKTLSWRLIR